MAGLERSMVSNTVGVNVMSFDMSNSNLALSNSVSTFFKAWKSDLKK